MPKVYVFTAVRDMMIMDNYISQSLEALKLRLAHYADESQALIEKYHSKPADLANPEARGYSVMNMYTDYLEVLEKLEKDEPGHHFLGMTAMGVANCWLTIGEL